MSLKAFHVVFITASSALAVGFGIWELKNGFSNDGSGWDFVYGVGSLIIGVGLLVYERYFLKKTKGLSYL